MEKTLLHFDFKPEQIAYFSKEKGEAKMLVVPKKHHSLLKQKRESITGDFIEYISSYDCLVINNTKVIPARLFGKNKKGYSVEILLLERIRDNVWKMMGKPGNRLKVGMIVYFPENVKMEVLDILCNGNRLGEFNCSLDKFNLWLKEHGTVPLPPYIKRKTQKDDFENYQSVFAKKEGSIAAPTASLHLSKEMLTKIAEKGVTIIEITLHIGAGTFQPLNENKVENHKMHSEFYEVSSQAAKKLNETRHNNGKIWAVGTTVARTLETVCQNDGFFIAKSGRTNLFIYPGYRWRAVDGLLTNFHWPTSSLIFLVASLLGIDETKGYYEFAVKNNYRLFSYGDAMLVC